MSAHPFGAFSCILNIYFLTLNLFNQIFLLQPQSSNSLPSIAHPCFLPNMLLVQYYLVPKAYCFPLCDLDTTATTLILPLRAHESPMADQGWDE